MEKLAQDILNILATDSRMAHDRIAKMLGKTAAEISAAVNQLEAEGIIVKYNTVINYDKFDEERVEALIEVKVSPLARYGFDQIAEELCRLDMVKSVYLMSGAYDLCLVVAGRSLKKVALFVSEKLASMDCVLSTATHFILKRYKSEGVIMEQKDEHQRLAVHQ